MQENTFSMNWVYMSQVNVIWPDSIKCNLLSCTHVIKLCGKFTCNPIQGQHFGHKYFLSVVRLCRLYQFLGFTYHGITIIRKWSGLHQVLKLFTCLYGFWPDHCNTSNLSLLSLSGCRFTGVLGIIVLLHNSVLAKLYQTDKWPWISLVCRGVHSHLNNWNWLKKQAQMVTSPPPCLTVVGVCNNIPMFVTSQTCCCTF